MVEFMSERDDGGPAFPAADRIDPAPSLGEGWTLVSKQPGMSLRDYFAGQAMQSYLDDPACRSDVGKLGAWSYEAADAMLKARKE